MWQSRRPSPGANELRKTVAQRHRSRLDKLRLRVHRVKRGRWQRGESGVLRKVERRKKEVESLETGATRWSQAKRRTLAEKCRTQASTAARVEQDARNLEIDLRRARTTAHGTGAVQDSGTDADVLGSMLKECTELRKAAAGAHQDLDALAERVDSLVAARPNNGGAPVVSLPDVAVAIATHDGAGEAETKGDTAASEPTSAGKGNSDDSDDSTDSDCRDGGSCKLGDQEVAHSFATVGKFLARFYCQASREYWHTDNMLSSQQLGSARLLSGRSAGTAGCVFMCLCKLCVFVCIMCMGQRACLYARVPRAQFRITLTAVLEQSYHLEGAPHRWHFATWMRL